MPREKEKELVNRGPRYGHLIYRRKLVTEGEIVEATRRGARTVEGIKLRTSAGFGRCQMGFCGLRMVEILAREQG